MKQGIHPEYKPAMIICSCGNTIETMSTQQEIHVEICSVCHPFYTGKQRLVDTAGRVERFKRKYSEGEKTEKRKSKKEKVAAAPGAQADDTREEASSEE